MDGFIFVTVALPLMIYQCIDRPRKLRRRFGEGQARRLPVDINVESAEPSLGEVLHRLVESEQIQYNLDGELTFSVDRH